MSSFHDDLPTDNPSLQPSAQDEKGYGEIYTWVDVVEEDGVKFDVLVTAHSDMWSGRGDRMDPANHLGPRVSIHCIEREPEETSVKGKALKRVRRHRGFKDLTLYLLSTSFWNPATTVHEAQVQFKEVLHKFLTNTLHR